MKILPIVYTYNSQANPDRLRTRRSCVLIDRNQVNKS